MSDYINSQQLSLKLASVTAQLSSLKQRQPKLDNLSRVLYEANREKERLLEHINLISQELERTRIQLALAVKQLNSNETEQSADNSLDSKKLQMDSLPNDDSVTTAKQLMQGKSNAVMENLIRELSLCKRHLQKLLDGKVDIRTFLKSADYEETISNLEDLVKGKDKEIEELRAEMKERDIEGNDKTLATKMDDMKQQMARLARALSVKTVLVNTMTLELDRSERECQAAKDKYNQEIHALREEKQRLSKHRSEDEQTTKADEELKKQLSTAAEEITKLNHKMAAFQKEYNILNEDFVCCEQTKMVLQNENQDLQKHCRELELRLQNCQSCRVLEIEKAELEKKTAQLEEELNLVTTQMKFFEEDFKHERKDREDMKNKYDAQLEEQNKKIEYFSMEIHRLGGLLRQEKLEKDRLRKQFSSQQHHNFDLATDAERQSSFHGGCKSYAYGQQRQPMWHSTLPSEVVADSDTVTDAGNPGSLASTMTRECPRCEREFGPQERDEFEKHVEKCLN